MIDGWRDRLLAEIERAANAPPPRHIARTQIGPRAGLGKSWENDFRTKGKDPSLPNLVAVCQALGVSVSYIVFGYDITPEEEFVLALYRRLPPSRQTGLKDFLRAFGTDEPSPQSPPSSDPV